MKASVDESDDSGQLLLSGASDGSVRMWKLDRRHYAPGLRPSAGFQAEGACACVCAMHRMKHLLDLSRLIGCLRC